MARFVICQLDEIVFHFYLEENGDILLMGGVFRSLEKCRMEVRAVIESCRDDGGAQFKFCESGECNGVLFLHEKNGEELAQFGMYFDLSKLDEWIQFVKECVKAASIHVHQDTE